MTANAESLIAEACARAIAPRKPLSVSQWADAERVLSRKDSAEPGRWRTARNPPLREPMDALSARSGVRRVVLRWPVQFGKTSVALNVLGYIMDHSPGPVMVALPTDVSREKWTVQKLNPMLDETPAARRALRSTASRDSANQRHFKDFAGGQLYLEHAGSPARLKSTTVRYMIVDEVDEFAGHLHSGDDPIDLLDGRTSSFPATSKHLYISTPGIQGLSRIDALFEQSDQRRYYVPCPDCGHDQPLEWTGLHWNTDASQCWYACRECGVVIDENHKTDMIARGRWLAEKPENKTRGYTLNGLYYPIGLGPRWLDLVEKWRNAQNDPARLKTFINDRLAESWEDPAMRAVKQNVIADRAEPYPLRWAPAGVLAATAGVDTQDNRLAVHITGWGRGLACWTLDYIELMGDPADDEVWVALTDLLNRPIEHEYGGVLRPSAVAIDAGGHRTEAVKAFVRSRRVRRPMAIFGAKPNNAPVLSRGKMQDVNWRGKYDKRGVKIHHVGTVAAKHWLYGRLSTDADKPSEQRLVHLSEDLPPEYFGGLVSETYNPSKNRFEKRRGPRNEPLDCWVYSYAAAHHQELRLHRYTRADWDAAEARLRTQTEHDSAPVPAAAPTTTPKHQQRRRNSGFGSEDWQL
ncbi:MAG: phage terminase large subunit family protein [Salinisphaera sp.]|nr:phage terminase large subunit family protein [Salinisphaera sp.]